VTKLARIPADVSKRLLIIACAAALITAACSDIPEGEVVTGEGPRFIVSVADSNDDVGLGNSVAVGPEGEPFFSYLIVPAELEPGEIPAARPIGAPYIQTATVAATDTEPVKPGKFGAAIGVGSVSADGIFTRGAAAQVRDTPTGITIPYGPATEQSLVGATAQSMNGTDIAIDAAAGKHVVWTGTDGVYYGLGSATSFAVEQLYDYGFALRKAGPIGRPDVAVDTDNNPWVAYTLSSQGQRVEVAIGSPDGWTTETAAQIGQCSDCPQPKRTQIGVTSAGPTVAYVDSADGSVKVAVRADDGAWTSSTVATGVQADGLSMAVDKDGIGMLSFYDGSTVKLAVQDGTGWSVTDVAQVDLGEAAQRTANFAPTTGVAVDEKGTRYVTFMNAGSILLLSSADGEAFAPEETGALGAAAFPAVAVAPDGTAIYVTWYDDESQLLKLGIHADRPELLIANPSPTPEVTGPAAGGDCGTDGEILLDIVALAGSVFDTNCLVAPAGEEFTVNYENTDTLPHNFNAFVSQGGESLGSTSPTPTAGPGQGTADIAPLDEGDYYFQCDAHPTTMFGTLAVVKARGGGNGGGAGGGNAGGGGN
jgi:plastocyanin